MVPGARVELANLSAQDPHSCVSAISTTRALSNEGHRIRGGIEAEANNPRNRFSSNDASDLDCVYRSAKSSPIRSSTRSGRKVIAAASPSRERAQAIRSA